MDTDDTRASDVEQEHSEALRRFIRHPADFPISFSLGAQQQKQHSMRDVSCGGLCFISDCPLERGEAVHISIPVEPPGFEADGIVVWCKPEHNRFAIGVEFDSDSTSFSLRMVEQVCHIEHYRAQVQRCEGRELSSEEAAEEWIAKFASSFPRH